jgi:hypothetical protein
VEPWLAPLFITLLQNNITALTQLLQSWYKLICEEANRKPLIVEKLNESIFT